MDKKIGLLQMWFNAFIDAENPKEFFIGMADYLKYSDSVPEFDQITSKIHAEYKPLKEKLQSLEEIALKKLKEIYKEVSEYISENKIEDEAVNKNIKECESWITGKTFGSGGIVSGLSVELDDTIASLYKIPEHKEFASKYIEFYKDNPDLISRYLKLQENEDFEEYRRELERKSEIELWGLLGRVGEMLETIKEGREKYKSLVDEYRKTNSSQISFNILNYAIPMSEWASIEEDKQKKDLFIFDVKKIRPWLRRIHNYVITEASQVNSEVQSKDKNYLQSMHLISDSLEPKNTIFLVLNETYNTPIRFDVYNKNGQQTSIKKLYDIAYIADAPNKKVPYTKRTSDNINNGLFKKPLVKKFMQTNHLKKSTLVQKSKENTLVLRNIITIKTLLIKQVPFQFQSLYIDKTK